MEIDAQQPTNNTQPMLLSPNNATVTLPPDEAAKAPYPPSCPVLCLFEDGQFRSGKVNSVKLSISFSTGNRFDIFYEIGFENYKPTMVRGTQLRLLVGCPVFISVAHFAKPVENINNWSPGVILGSFEVPCKNCQATGHQQQQKFFYSVRMLVLGNEIDEHGVDPQNIIYRSRHTNEVTILRSQAAIKPFDHIPIPAKMRHPSSSLEERDRKPDANIEKTNSRTSVDGKSINPSNEEGASVVRSLPPKVTKADLKDFETLSNTESSVLGIKKSPFRKFVSAADETAAKGDIHEKEDTPVLVMNEENDEVEENENGKENLEELSPPLTTEATSNSSSPYKKAPLVVLVNEDEKSPTKNGDASSREEIAHDAEQHNFENGIGHRPEPPETMRMSNLTGQQSSFHNYQPPAPDEIPTANEPTYDKSFQIVQAAIETQERTLLHQSTHESTLQTYGAADGENKIPLEEYYVHPKQVGYQLPKEGLLRSFNIEYPSVEEAPPQRQVDLLRGWGAHEEPVDEKAHHPDKELEQQPKQASPEKEESSLDKRESLSSKEDDFRVPTTVMRRDTSIVSTNGTHPSQNDISALTVEPVWRQPRKQLTPMPASKMPTSSRLNKIITKEDRQNIFRERIVKQREENNAHYVGNKIQPTVSAMTEATDYNKQGGLPNETQMMPNAQIPRSEAVQNAPNGRKFQPTTHDMHRKQHDPREIGTAQQFHDVILNASGRDIVSNGKAHYRKEDAPYVVWDAGRRQFVTQYGQPLEEVQMAMLANQLQYASGNGKHQQGFPPNHHQTEEVEDNDEVDETFASPHAKGRAAAHEEDRLPFETTHDLSPIIIKASPTIGRDQKKQQREDEKTTVDIGSVNGSMISILSDTFPTKEGCYLVYGTESGGKLSLYYSRTAIGDAIGFWMPGAGKAIQGFKFHQNCGRVEIIKGIAGGDANKKKYYSGWCQFVKAARAFNGLVCKWPDRAGIEVDLYVFYNETSEVTKIEDGELFDTSKIDAVSCLRKGATCFEGVKKTPKRVFLDKGNSVGRSMDVVS